jgi:hypothetical protein
LFYLFSYSAGPSDHGLSFLIRSACRMVFGAAALLASVVACGPSFQAVYEGDVHFEHCYAIEQRTVPIEEKKECWRDWLGGYTYGQSNDRVEYAATRFSQLSLDPTLPTEDVRAAPRKQHRLAAPLPTSAFAPPPNINASGPANPPDGAEPPADVKSVDARNVPPRPGAACVTTCREGWNDCHGSCKDRACEPCDKAYRACVPACFREGPAATGQKH